MDTAGRGALLVAVVVLSAAVVPAVGLSGDGIVLAQETTPTNETVRHVDPDRANAGSNLDGVERYLANQLADRLGNSTRSITQGQYAQAREALGGEYEGQLGRYVEVTGGTGDAADDTAVQSFRAAGQLLGRYADRLAAFNETARAYRAATQAGSADRARQLARTLIDRAQRVNQTGSMLVTELATIQNRTGRNFTAQRQGIRTETARVMARAAAVRDAAFTRTRLTATATGETVSFRQPARIRGRLVAVNGSGIAGRTVLVGYPAEAVAVETNETGWFTATYRPALLPVEPGVVPVRYVPEPGSKYLGARANVSVTVEPITPTLTARVESGTVAYGDRVVVRGAMWADQRQISGASLVLTVDGIRLDRVRTGPFGWYVAEIPLPAAVSPGEHEVDVRLDQSGRAIQNASASSSLTVASTATDIALDASLHENETLVVDGRLRTEGGVGVEGRTVELATTGTTAASVETDRSGHFSTTLGPEEYTIGSDGGVNLTARFDGAGTNLESSTAQQSLPAPWVQDASGDGSVAWLVGLVVALLVTLGAVVVWWRRDRWFDTGGAAVEGATPADGKTTTTDADRRAEATAWQEDVSALLSAGETDRAVETAYGALRRHLADELDLGGALTHWEIYMACAEDGLAPERVDAIRAVTEAYERARFAPGPLSTDEAGTAVQRIADAL